MPSLHSWSGTSSLTLRKASYGKNLLLSLDFILLMEYEFKIDLYVSTISLKQFIPLQLIPNGTNWESWEESSFHV